MHRALPIPLTLVERVARQRGLDRRDLACCLDLLSVADELERSLLTWLSDHALSPSKFTLLAALADQDGQSPSALATQLGVRRPTLTGLLDNLQSQGYISRQHTAADRRRWSIHLSASGRALAERAIDGQLQRLAGAVAPLEISERSALRKLLAQLVARQAPTTGRPDSPWTQAAQRG